MDKNLPIYEHLLCCDKPERAIKFDCNKKGLTYVEIDEWLRKITTLNFVHIVKRRYNQVGYVHFSNQSDCKKFYDEMKERAHKGPKDTIIEFIHDIHDVINDEKDYRPVPYRVYDKDNAFEIFLLTPRITEKTNYKIQGVDKKIVIEGCFPSKSTRSDCVIDLFPEGNFKINIELPSCIDHNETVNITINNGITKIEIKKLGDQLRSLRL